jgi:hypothetical protein
MLMRSVVTYTMCFLTTEVSVDTYEKFLWGVFLASFFRTSKK